MNKLLGVVLLLGSIALMAYGQTKMSSKSYFGGFSDNCKNNPVKAWSYNYKQSTITIQIGKIEYDSILPEYYLNHIPRNKKLSAEGCKMVKQGLIHNGNNK